MMNTERKRQTVRLILLEAGTRLDQAICDQCDDLSRTLVRKVIDAGGVHVNGRRVRQCGGKTSAGDKVEIFIDGLPYKYFRLSDHEIIYQDPFILVVNKPAFIESQPTPARYKGTLYEALLLWLQDPYKKYLKPSIGMVQRLDRETSGVMIFSIHHRAHKSLTQAFSQHGITKKYLALVSGSFENNRGEFVSQLAKNRATNKMKTVEKGGKLAITKYKLLKQFENCALVEVSIPTGRMHQIRVHFSEAGHPLVGDLRYGYQANLLSFSVQRTMLHSWILACQHPVSGESITFQAPVARDMNNVLTQLGYDDVNLS